MVAARERLEAARALLEHQLFGAAVSDAYYALLYAARAALSERERNAKTHRGTWSLFREEFVVSGEFDADLARAARATQAQREDVDYAAGRVADEDAVEIVGLAERFVGEVERLLA